MRTIFRVCSPILDSCAFCTEKLKKSDSFCVFSSVDKCLPQEYNVFKFYGR